MGDVEEEEDLDEWYERCGLDSLTKFDDRNEGHMMEYVRTDAPELDFVDQIEREAEMEAAMCRTLYLGEDGGEDQAGAVMDLRSPKMSMAVRDAIARSSARQGSGSAGGGGGGGGRGGGGGGRGKGRGRGLRKADRPEVQEVIVGRKEDLRSQEVIKTTVKEFMDAQEAGEEEDNSHLQNHPLLAPPSSSSSSVGVRQAVEVDSGCGTASSGLMAAADMVYSGCSAEKASKPAPVADGGHPPAQQPASARKGKKKGKKS